MNWWRSGPWEQRSGTEQRTCRVTAVTGNYALSLVTCLFEALRLAFPQCSGKASDLMMLSWTYPGHSQGVTLVGLLVCTHVAL